MVNVLSEVARLQRSIGRSITSASWTPMAPSKQSFGGILVFVELLSALE